MLGCTCDMWWSDLWPRADARQFGLCCCCLSVILSTSSMWLQLHTHQLLLLDRRGFFASLSNADEDCGQTHLVLSLVSSASSKCSKVVLKSYGSHLYVSYNKYLDYNKEMFCACKIDIYHVTTTTSYSRTITVTWMLRFRGLILPLLTPSDWHAEWRRRPEAELAWLRGLGPPPSPALPPGPSSSLHSVIFVYGRGRVGRNYRWLHSTRYNTLYLHYINFISTLYLLYIYTISTLYI